MTQLYNNIYNLFHQWLNTKEEDKTEFQKWLKAKIIYRNGYIYINQLTE